jgi:hypothetical protein
VDAGPDFRCCRGRHNRKIKRSGTTVEGAGDGLPSGRRRGIYFCFSIIFFSWLAK